MRKPSRTAVVSTLAVVAAAAGGAAAAPAAFSASKTTSPTSKTCGDTCKDKRLIQKTTGGQTIKKWKVTVSNGATSPVKTLGEVKLTPSCNGNFWLAAATTSSGATGTLAWHVEDQNGTNFTRVDSSFGSGSDDNIAIQFGTGGVGQAEALLSDGTVETIDYAYASTSDGGCMYWGDAIYG
jgi:hypothetical protein